MKKYFFGLLAATMALCTLAFTKPSPSHNTAAGYWFPYNAAGTVVLDVTSAPALTSTDPFGCSGTHIKCAQENDNFNMISSTDYAPAGNILKTDLRN